jgi:ribosome-associated translation inhibitor RaiA
VRLKHAAPLVLEDVQSDLYVAIDRAADRVGRTLDRRLARRRAGPVRRLAHCEQPTPLDPESGE